MVRNGFLVAVLIGVAACAVGPQGTAPEPSGRRLRAIMEDKYADNSIIVGGTAGSMAFGTTVGEILDREFNYVTPENDFKQLRIHPDNSDTWKWQQADAWVDHIATNGQILRIHGPIGPQCSQWAMDDNRTPSELDLNMRAYMQALCERYNGTPGFEYLDVVNETVVKGAWHTDKPGVAWECPWYRIGLGSDPNSTPLYIAAAFEIANQYAPDMKLIYNHHENPERTSSWNLIKDTIAYLRNRGLRVNGIGWQAHVETGWATDENLDALRDLIDWAQSCGLEFHVTEASAWLKQGHTEQDLQAQAATYRAIVEVLLEKRSAGVVGWNTWHISDWHTFHAEWRPALFDARCVAKPAYYAIQDTLENGPDKAAIR